MFYDIFLPQANESELANIAKEFNIKPIFLYNFKTKKEILKKKEELQKQGISCYVGSYIKPNSAQDIKKGAKLWLASDFLAVIEPGQFIRQAVSNPRIDAVFGVPNTFGRDYIEYRASNWNVVLTNIAKKSKVCYGIDFSQILKCSGFLRAKLIGREMQNIRLCRGKIPILIASLANEPWQIRWPTDLAAFGRILGLNAPQSKAAVSTLYKFIIRRKEERRSPTFIMPGVKLIEQ
ncbi:MAG: RNase P subunit p30 family protein [Candidatus Nanoarchaeia archaeon]